jgi:PE-PPE domain
MPGKHRKPSRRRSKAARRLAPSLTAAAVSATSLTTALTTGTTVTVSPAVELTALITPANSTAQIFASSDYYNQNWTPFGTPQVVPFFLGPQGIVNAIDGSTGDPRGIVVLASGWGAGQTGTALAMMQANHDQTLNDLKLVVLDNNTNRAGGGFWTTYGLFAPLLLTSAAPTPSNTGAPILDVAYEYNINSDAPTDPLNPFADANSLVAYVYGYGAQATAPVPGYVIAEAENPAGPHYHYILKPDGTEAQAPILLPNSTTTYVTFTSDRLPLVRPLLLLPGGEIVADAVEPILTELVDAGYKDGQPIPLDPTVPRPMELGSSLSNIITASNSLPGALQQGVQDGTAAAQTDLSSPGKLVTGPTSEITKTAGLVTNGVTNNSPVPLASTSQTPLSASPFNMTTGGRFVPGATGTNTSSPGGSGNPRQQVVGSVTSALGGLANSLTGGLKNAAGPSSGSTPGSP